MASALTRAFRADPRRHEGAAAQPTAESFFALPLLVLVIPWGYPWRTYVVGASPARANRLVRQGS